MVIPSANQQSRRGWLAATIGLGSTILVAGIGCSSATKKKKARGTGPNANRPKGPNTMGNLLVDSYIDDLKKGPADKQISAAQELGNMGASAKQALPALQRLVKDNNAKVRAAAQQAVKAIRK